MKSFPVNISTHALAARSIREELKQKIPNVRFKIRSSTFSGGDAVDVSWEDGVQSDVVYRIINKYQLGEFDGNTDSYNWRETKFHKEFGGVKYVLCHRRRTLREDIQ